MSILHRLSLRQKSLILGLLALLLVMPPSALYLERAFEDVALARKEAQGIPLLRAISRVIQLTQTHRGIAAAILSGNEALGQRGTAVRDALTEAMAQVDLSLRSSAASAHTMALWAADRNAWAALEQGLASQQLDADDSTYFHTELTAGYFLLSEAVMDEFGLSIDSHLDSRMLVQASLVDAMVLAERLGVMRARGTVYLTQRVLPAEGRTLLQVDHTRAMQVQVALFHSLSKAAKANADIKARLGAVALLQQKQIVKTLILAEQKLTYAQELKHPPEAYFDELTRTIDGLYAFNKQATEVLAQTLQARANSAQQMAFGMLILLALGAVAVGALGWVFVRSITGPVQEAANVAKAMAAGDLTTKVRVRGSNEIGRLMMTLGEMQHKLAAGKAAQAQQRLAAQVFLQSPNGILITDANGVILLINPAFSQITGYSPADVIGANPRLLASGLHERTFYASMWHSLNNSGAWEGEISNRHKSGAVYSIWKVINRMTDEHGITANYVATFTDLTEKKSDEERIRHMANFDTLTCLPNRSLLRDHFALARSHAQRGGESMALLFLDLDNFKHINDSLGHGIGDELLVCVARRMRQQVREQDTVARLGGDEFVLLLPGTDADGASHLARKLLDSSATPNQIGDRELTVTASIGIAMYPQDGQDLETLAKHADVAMYRAKQDGRNAYCFYTPEMQANSVRTLLLEGELRRALELEQLTLHYQPQLCLQTERIIGVEALLRWTHPELGRVSPAEFIPIAEKSGLILPIGEWVLRTAVQQLASWMEDGLAPVIMSVNLSAVQFRHPNLPALVSSILGEVGLATKYLELELTEGLASHDPNGAISIMADLRARGVRMSIDDFGTGYSSLSYLKRFQVHKLKIDMSFVRDITHNPQDQAIVRAIIGMAASLGLQTIAEGVETREQLDFLRAQGCDEIQGYFCSKPLAASDCEDYLRGRLQPLCESVF